MQSIIAEARKQRAFREAWIGGLLAALFLSVFIFMDSGELGLWAPWYQIQQDIHRYLGVLTAFLLVIGLSRLMCYETEQRTAGFIGSAAHGPNFTWGAKAGLSVLYCAAVVFALGAVTLTVQGLHIGFRDALSPVTDCVYYESVPMSNIAFCAMQYLLLFLGSLYFAGFILIVAAVTKRTALTISICGGSWLALLCYQFFLRGLLNGSTAKICRVMRPICDFIFRFSFCGFMQLESYRWTSSLGQPGEWNDLWKPILLVLAITAAEFSALRLIWRRGAKS